jgi:SpoVK/Ycf46/Vps4 family AAA+-type ATPase
MTTPSKEFKQRLLDPINSLFKEALDDVGLDQGPRNRNNDGTLADSIISNMANPEKNRRSITRNTGFDERAYQRAIEELQALTGLTTIKTAVHRLADLARINQQRKKLKLKGGNPALHMVFTGNPGTGKTTVARLIGKILHSIGILSSGHTVETDKSGLIGGFLGQTPGMVKAKVDEAMGGVLYIDEAYSLTEDDRDLYGREAVDTLLKRMEDDRGNLVVIVAGYPEKMKTFIQSNPGLRSRFTRTIRFPDYSPAELQEIFCLLCANNGLNPTGGFLLLAEMAWDTLWKKGITQDGNGRIVRTALEHAMENQAVRLRKQEAKEAHQLIELVPADWNSVEHLLIESYDNE